MTESAARLFQHVVLLKFPEPLSEADDAELRAMIGSWHEEIGTLRECRFGRDLTGKRARGYQYLLHTVFPDEKVFREYVAHPAHQQVVSFLEARNCERLAIDFYFDASTGAG